MAKRGFFAELQHQNQIAARQREREQLAAARHNAAVVRQHEQAQRQAEQARARATRASAAEQKQAEAEARRLHLEARAAEVETLNAQLARTYDDIDNLLAFTLAFDDYVDLETLRAAVEHPPFPRPDLEQPLVPPPPLQAPPEPQWNEPPAPTGLGGAFGGKKRHAEERAKAWAAYSGAQQAWQGSVAQIPTLQLQQMQVHQQAQQQREAQLADARRQYDAECADRQRVADETNRNLDELVTGLAAGAETSVQEYVSIVLGNSVYPECFAVDHNFEFDSDLRELSLKVTVPSPDHMPRIKAYKYAKASDEITSTDFPAKVQKDRYASALHQAAVRSLHEIFEADRTGTIGTISLTVGADSIDPATGQNKHTPLVAVAVDRDTFLSFDLALVVPQATLAHLGALVSKNPYGLVAIDTSQGVRGK
ncbi:MAG: hypothetical protein JWN46_639 [Acidimicrobiales bacterium]|nr:hypothetical protein [Acidimicrobiales bacterium]